MRGTPRRSRSLSPAELRRRLNEMSGVLKRVKRLEGEKKEKEFKDAGIEKQAEFVREVGAWLKDDLIEGLEQELGRVPSSHRDIVKKGELLVEDRVHILRVADKYGWAGVAEFLDEELARNEKADMQKLPSSLALLAEIFLALVEIFQKNPAV